MTDFAGADALAATLGNLRDELPGMVFMDEFAIRRVTGEADDGHGSTVPTWGVVGSTRGLLVPRSVERGEVMDGNVVLTETPYRALLPHDIDLTTADELEHIGSGRRFGITDVSVAASAGVITIATLEESSR